jgi:hypothetical protein
MASMGPRSSERGNGSPTRTQFSMTFWGALRALPFSDLMHRTALSSLVGKHNIGKPL